MTSGVWATYDVRVAWSSVVTNAFTFGTSTLGGGDVLVGQFATTFSGTNDNVSTEVEEFKIERGKDSYLDQVQSGKATIVLKDLNGKYNPKNPSSVLAGKLIPMRPVRIQATYNSITYGLFWGFVRNIEYDAENYQATIEAEDLFMWMSRVRPVIASTGQTTTGAAIGKILDAVGWTDATLRSLSTGDTIPDFSADGSSDALTLVSGLLETELGTCYVNGSGVFVYESRYVVQTRSSAATITNSLTGIRPGTDLDRIVNRASVTRTGGVQQNAVDGDSIAVFGASDALSIDSPYLNSDTQAASLAAYLVSIRKDPRSPALAAQMWNDNASIFPHMLGRELQEVVTVSETRGGTTGTWYIEGIAHEVSEGGKLHSTAWKLSEPLIVGDPFILGSSTLGGGDVLVF